MTRAEGRIRAHRWTGNPARAPKLLRKCRKCEAGPGNSCGSWKDYAGLPVWVTVKKPHQER